MNIGEILIWESSNLLLLIPAVIGLLVLTRWLEGRTVFTERDWLFLIGHPRKKVFSLHNLIVKVSLPRSVQRLSYKATDQKFLGP